MVNRCMAAGTLAASLILTASAWADASPDVKAASTFSRKIGYQLRKAAVVFSHFDLRCRTVERFGAVAYPSGTLCSTKRAE